MSMTGQRIGAAGGFNENVRPKHSRFDVHGRHLADAHADFIAAEPRTFPPRHSFLAYLDDRPKKKIATRPATGFKQFRRHTFARDSLTDISRRSRPPYETLYRTIQSLV